MKLDHVISMSSLLYPCHILHVRRLSVLSPTLRKMRADQATVFFPDLLAKVLVVVGRISS